MSILYTVFEHIEDDTFSDSTGECNLITEIYLVS